jgi:hypothetical protein
MYRRRRSTREIAFSFDSFLDVVANVIGIIIRLILVAWVGARSYSAAMQLMEAPAPASQPLPAPTADDDPATAELNKVRRELAEARRRLLEQMGHLKLADDESRVSSAQLKELEGQHRELEKQASRLGVELAGKGAKVNAGIASAESLKKRGEELLKQIRAIEKMPSQKQVLKYHTPVSHVVHADEMFFECRRGRVTYIDLPAFMQEIQATLADRAQVLKTQWHVAAVTSPVGAFRLRYLVEREKGTLESFGGGPSGGGFRYGLSEWTLEPISEDRGETLDAALKEGSQFRRLADRVDAQITVVTFWVYEDSFEPFRKLRDHLYERDIEVAGRPLTADAPISASRHGTASRGQ